MNNYWDECISEAFESAGIKATKEQIETVSIWVEGAHENYGMAFGHDAIPNPVIEENKKLEKQLDDERRKVWCAECNGTGSITTHGPVHSGTSQCWKCRGEGRLLT